MRRVLIVENELAIREAYQYFFAKDGFETDCARGADEASHFLATRTYDVAIVDIRLEDQNGGESTEIGIKLLKDMNLLVPQLPVIVVTSFRDDRIVQGVRPLNIVKAYLTKPTSCGEIVETASRLMVQPA